MIVANIGIGLNMGVVPPLTKPKAKITAFGVSKDFGAIPPKNFFRSKISTVDVSGEVTGMSVIGYQIH